MDSVDVGYISVPRAWIKFIFAHTVKINKLFSCVAWAIYLCRLRFCWLFPHFWSYFIEIELGNIRKCKLTKTFYPKLHFYHISDFKKPQIKNTSIWLFSHRDIIILFCVSMMFYLRIFSVLTPYFPKFKNIYSKKSTKDLFIKKLSIKC